MNCWSVTLNLAFLYIGIISQQEVDQLLSLLYFDLS